MEYYDKEIECMSQTQLKDTEIEFYSIRKSSRNSRKSQKGNKGLK